jgi:hypothetical protein
MFRIIDMHTKIILAAKTDAFKIIEHSKNWKFGPPPPPKKQQRANKQKK